MVLRLTEISDEQIHEIGLEEMLSHARTGKIISNGLICDGRRWDFAMRGPFGFVCLFMHDREGKKAYVKRSVLIDPAECGDPLEKQVAAAGHYHEIQKTIAVREANCHHKEWTSIVENLKPVRESGTFEEISRRTHVAATDSEFSRAVNAAVWNIGDCIVRHELCFVNLDGNGKRFAVFFRDLGLGEVEIRGSDSGGLLLAGTAVLKERGAKQRSVTD